MTKKFTIADEKFLKEYVTTLPIVFDTVHESHLMTGKELKEMGYEVKKSQIKLDKPIKELGEFPVKINLDHNLEIEIKVLVSQGATETESEI